MKRCHLFAVIFTSALLLAFILICLPGSESVPDADSITTIATPKVPFIENRGQIEEDVAYYASISGGTFYVTGKGALGLLLPARKGVSPRHIIGEDFVEGSQTLPRGGERPDTQVNVYRGSDPEQWKTGLHTYHSVILEDLYDGIELELKAYGKSIEKVFRVAPQAVPSRIRIRTTGVENMVEGKNGELVLETAYGPVVYSRPVAYQEANGTRNQVEVSYALYENSYGFRLGNYDPGRELIIDPLLQSTYVGGMGGDSVDAIKINPTTGKVYICGSTLSTGFGPTALSQTDSDAYVARLDAGLTAFEEITRFEGSTNDVCLDLRLDPGNARVFLLGSTNSTDFPLLNEAQNTLGGDYDTFAVKLDNDLLLSASTYLGGSGLETPVDMAVNESTGDLFVLGDTLSTNFPTTAGAPQESSAFIVRSTRDGFIVRYDGDLAVQVSTYLSGGLHEDMGAIRIHPVSGDVYVAGDSNSEDLPGRTGGAQESNHGIYDAFVARYNSTLTSLLQTSYIGGDSGSETDVHMEIHPTSGKIYLVGITNSRAISGYVGFPVVNAVQSTYGGSPSDLFAALFNATLTTIEAATYLGGDDLEDVIPGNLVLTDDAVYVAGETDSLGWLTADFATEGVFAVSFSTSLNSINRKVYLGGYFGSGMLMHPNGTLYVAGDAGAGVSGTAGGAQETFGGGTYDAFVMRLSPDLTAIEQTTYLGGSDNDVSVHHSRPHLVNHPVTGNIYIAGKTGPVGLGSYVGDFPGTAGGAQEDHGGDTDGFVAVFDATLSSSPACTDNDGDGYSIEGGDCGDVDCRDDNAAINPGATELCNYVDDNCNGQTDEGLLNTYYADNDMDGYGDLDTSTLVCEFVPPSGFTTDNTDCDDHNDAVHPGATEICNGVDDDCNDLVDDGLPLTTYYADADSDTFGDPDNSTQSCYDTPPAGYRVDNSDCDDTDPNNYPGNSEICDRKDNDCDLEVDEGLPQNTFYIDNDGDDYGTSAATVQQCGYDEPAGYSIYSGDCNDADASINPGATEVCNDLVDQDCDALIDCDDSDCSSDAACTVNTSCWDILEVDDAIYSVDIAVDSNDSIHMCYFAPNPEGSGAFLRYVTGEADAPVESWTTEDITGALIVDPGAQCAIAAGSDGSVHIAYVLDRLTRLLYAYRDNSDWHDIQMIEESGVDGECAITLDSDNLPHISYRKNLGDSVEVRHATTFRDTLAFTTETVFSATEGLYTGTWNDIAVSADGTPCISFSDDSFRQPDHDNSNPFIYRKVDGIWEEYEAIRSFSSILPYDVASYRMDYGYCNRLELDSADGIHLSSILLEFLDAAGREYHSTGEIAYRLLENLSNPVSGLYQYKLLENLTAVELAVDLDDLAKDLAIDNENNAHFAFYDIPSGSLRYKKAYTSEYPIDGIGDMYPEHTQIIDDNGDAGRSPTIAVDGFGGIHIAYLVNGSELRYAKKDECSGLNLALSPLRWHFNTYFTVDGYRTNAGTKIFYLKNLGDQIVDVTALNLTGENISFDDSQFACYSPDGCIIPTDVSPENPQKLLPGEVYSFKIHYDADSDFFEGQLVAVYNLGTLRADISGEAMILGHDDTTEFLGCTCALSNSGEKARMTPVTALIAFAFGLFWWRRKRLD